MFEVFLRGVTQSQPYVWRIYLVVTEAEEVIIARKSHCTFSSYRMWGDFLHPPPSRELVRITKTWREENEIPYPRELENRSLVVYSPFVGHRPRGRFSCGHRTMSVLQSPFPPQGRPVFGFDDTPWVFTVEDNEGEFNTPFRIAFPLPGVLMDVASLESRTMSGTLRFYD